jgi:hypothetical protein
MFSLDMDSEITQQRALAHFQPHSRTSLVSEIRVYVCLPVPSISHPRRCSLIGVLFRYQGTHTHKHIYIYTYIHTLYTCIYSYEYICEYIRVYVYIHTHARHDIVDAARHLVIRFLRVWCVH